MRRLLIMLAVVGLLAACTTSNGGGASSESDGPSAGSTGTEPSAPASSASSDAAGSGAAATPSPACEEAFAPLADLGIESTTDLGDLAEVEATVESCESVADWIATAESTLGIEVRPGTADLLLRIRCEDPSLGSAPICQELSSS